MKEKTQKEEFIKEKDAVCTPEDFKRQVIDPIMEGLVQRCEKHLEGLNESKKRLKSKRVFRILRIDPTNGEKIYLSDEYGVTISYNSEKEVEGRVRALNRPVLGEQIPYNYEVVEI